MSTRRAAGLFLFMGMAFGVAFPAIKAGLADAPPLLFAALRYDLAALLLLAYAAFVLRDWRPHRRADWLAVLAGGVLFFGSSGFLYLGQQYTTAGVPFLLVSSMKPSVRSADDVSVPDSARSQDEPECPVASRAPARVTGSSRASINWTNAAAVGVNAGRNSSG